MGSDDDSLRGESPTPSFRRGVVQDEDGHDRPQSGITAIDRSRSASAPTASEKSLTGLGIRSRGRRFASHLISKNRDVATPLKNVFVGRGSDGDSGRVSSLGDSEHRDLADPSVRPEAKVESAGNAVGRSSSHGDEESHVTTATTFDQGLSKRSTVVSINEDDASRMVNTSNSIVPAPHSHDGRRDARHTMMTQMRDRKLATRGLIDGSACISIEDENANKKMDPRKSSGDSERASGQLKKNIRAKAMQSNLSSARFTAAGATSRDQFESRLKAKANENNLSMENTANEHHGKGIPPVPTAGDQFESRLRAKAMQNNPSLIEKENNTKKAMNHIHSMEVARIEELAARGKCSDILQYLQDYPDSPPALVTVALEKLCGSLSSAHRIFDSSISGRKVATRIKALDGDWSNLLTFTVLTDHISDEALQLVALRVIWSMVALTSRYSEEFLSHGLLGLESVMKTHPRDKLIQEYGSGIVACLASNVNHAVLLLSPQNIATVKILGQALCSNSCSALKALFRLLVASRQLKKSPDHLIETIGTCTHRERHRTDKLANAINVILGVMHECPLHSGVQTWGFRLLLAIFSDGFQQICPPALTHNILDHLEVTVASSQTPRAVQESAICLLSRMSCCSDLLAGNEEAFSRIAVESMIKTQPKSRTVAMHGCYCISNIPCTNENTSTALSGVMEAFEDEEVADIAMNSIAILMKRNFNCILTLLRNSKFIYSIVGCMSGHPNSSSIQIASCDVLSNIALSRHVMNEICSCGGVGATISILHNLSQDSLAVCKAFLALEKIIGACDAELLKKCSAPTNVLRAMEANLTDICTQIQGATILWSLGSRHSTLQREIIQIGGIHSLSLSMGNFIASEPLQEKGIIALWSLAASASLEPALTSRAIEAITDAIAAHCTSAKICEPGMGALSTLATTKSVVKDAETVVDLIFSCMWLHSHEATVQQGALAALSKISVDQPSNVVLQITPADLDCVINSMRMHQLTKDVQENALILLRSYALSPTNIDVMGQSTCLVGLIKTAMSNFPGSLRVNVEYLLWLLPSDSQ